jgi:hypothetical protein
VTEPSLLRAYATPLALFVLSIAGLGFALVYDGAIDVGAVLFVIAPLVVLARTLFRRERKPPTSPITRIS